MYSRPDRAVEKKPDHLDVKTREVSPSFSPHERPINPLARTLSPRIHDPTDFDTVSPPSTRSVPRKQHNQQVIAEQKRRRRRRLIILFSVVSGVIAVALSLGLGLGLTIGRKQHSSRLPTYIPEQVQHKSPENDIMAQMFEWNIPKNASHWTTVAGQLQNLKVLGVKNIWIPPATKNSNRGAIGYDVYDLWDLGEFDAQGNVSTNMGSKKQLQKLVQQAKDHDIGIIFDAVLNQRTGGDKKITCNAHMVNDSNRLESTSGSFQIDAWLQFDFPARNGKYSQKTWGCDDFTAIDVDVRTGKSGVYKIEGADNAFATDVSTENVNYDYLLLSDVAYENPSVRADALSWVKWVHSELQLAGFRLDAAKHLSESFVLDVLNTVKQLNHGQDKFFAAEYFTGNLTEMTMYFESLESRPMMFDTLLLTNFAQFSAGGLTDFSKIFNYTFLAEHPEKTVTFVTTHDTQPGQSLDVLNVSNWFTTLAYAIILLRRDGLPCLFYGDIYGTYNEYSTVFTPSPYRQVITNMAVARKYWAYGDQTDYLDGNATIGWTRTGIPGDRPDGLAAVVSIAYTSSELKMNVGAHHAGETWSDITRNIISKTVVIDQDGNGVFPVRGQSASIWVNVGAQEGRDSLSQFDSDVYGLSPFEIGHATSEESNDGGGGGGISSKQQQVRLKMSNNG